MATLNIKQKRKLGKGEGGKKDRNGEKGMMGNE